jgi:hypothetical protein
MGGLEREVRGEGGLAGGGGGRRAEGAGVMGAWRGLAQWLPYLVPPPT